MIAYLKKPGHHHTDDKVETTSVSTIATNHPKLTLSPSDSEVVHYVNDSHIVNCNAYGTTRVRWLNPKQTVIEETKGRIHIEERTDGSTALVFETITLQDKGEWSCQGEIGDVQKSFNMVINQPISFVDTPVVQSVREDRDAVIRCMVTADPEPTISCFQESISRKYAKLPTEKYVKVVDGLAIKKVSKNDSGEYTCKAFQISTTISNVKEQTIRLNIQHIPIRPPQKASADVQFGYLYGIVNLTCEAEAEPAAEFTWYRHNKKLNPKVHLIHSEGHESILQILVNDSKAFGEYKCKAENSLGTLERVITLTQGVKPEKPTNLALRGVNSDTFDVDVGAVRKTKERDPMDVNGYRFEIIESEKFRLGGRKWDNARVMILGFEDGITYLINNLSANTSYLVRVASRNPAGLSDWTGPKEFHTTPREPLGLMPTNSASGLIFSYVTCQVFVVSTFTFLISNFLLVPSSHTRLLIMT
ncbi:hypothetical protein HA402_004633 [Bradysia odoriphaga]|nr:hypothetical protein HA402_004633 [Bradysia odoriphaga]